MKATGRDVSDQTVSNVLKNLRKMCFIKAKLENGRKVCKIPDTMIREALGDGLTDEATLSRALGG